MAMERNGDGCNTAERRGEAQRDGEHSARRLNGSIAAEAFSCGVCAQPLGPPIFQCSSGSFICSSCRDKLPDNKCPFCSHCALGRSLGMERAIRSILVDCCYAEHGCAEKMAYCDKGEHEKACPRAPPCLCPEAGCGFATGQPAGLLDHLTGHHKWPATTFQYWMPFGVRVAEPGPQVLHSKDDGQLFVVSVQPVAKPAGRAVSVVFVPPCQKPTGFGCSVVFSCFSRHHGTSTLDDLRPLRLSDWPPGPTDCICVLPNRPDLPDNAEVVLEMHIVCADRSDDEDDDLDDDSTYTTEISDSDSP